MLSAAQVPALLGQQLAWVYPPPRLRGLEHLTQTIGYLPSGVDLGQEILSFEVEAVVGFYAPLTQRMYVVTDADAEGNPISDGNVSEEVTLHELVHALQGQHSPLLDVAIGMEENFDVGFALGALLEGDALWTRFYDVELETGIPVAESARNARFPGPETGAALYPDTARAVRDPFLLQYSAGYRLAEQIANRGGPAALSSALLDPPLSSRQVLHPEFYLDPRRRRPPAFLSLPRSDELLSGCREIARNTLGEVGLRVWFAERKIADSAERQRAASGWAGDRVVSFACSDGAAFFWLVRFDTAEDADEFADLASRAIANLARDANLRAPASVWAERRDVVLAAGLAPRDQARLLDGAKATVYPDLEAYLRQNPEVIERAHAMRARALGTVPGP